jgi:hypothetical protein
LPVFTLNEFEDAAVSAEQTFGLTNSSKMFAIAKSQKRKYSSRAAHLEKAKTRELFLRAGKEHSDAPKTSSCGNRVMVHRAPNFFELHREDKSADQQHTAFSAQRE